MAGIGKRNKGKDFFDRFPVELRLAEKAFLSNTSKCRIKGGKQAGDARKEIPFAFDFRFSSGFPRSLPARGFYTESSLKQ